ncbi:MAG: metal-dependent transcriptional regulator [Bryobacterales bacterium]|nr:metal-dependent transcriptional regulator [Bryobacterales bacterium]
MRTVPTESTDNYLKAVFEITAIQERASTTEIARRLKVSAASVTGMLKKLASATPALVTYAKHRGAELTHEGQQRAIEVIRHHRLIESYLYEALDYGWDEVHEEAEKLEHFISEDLEDRMAAKLGYPEYDPHGHPIPRRNGTIPACEDIALRLIGAGGKVRLNRVADDDSASLRTVAGLGITLYSTMEVLEQRKPGGETVLRNAGGFAVTLPREIAARLRVTLVSGAQMITVDPASESIPLASGFEHRADSCAQPLKVRQ